MDSGHFYYINDTYFKDFPDATLMRNKEMVNGQVHDRPCYYAFQDSKTSLHWMIPISSRIDKFQHYYQQKIERYGNCDTIAFGDVLGHKKAFLIQNMCPVTDKYINNEYFDNSSKLPVRVDGAFEKELVSKAKHVLALQRKGIKLIFPDVLTIESKLLNSNT